MEIPEGSGPLLRDRSSGNLIREIVLGDKLLQLAYHRCSLPFSEWILFRNHLFSRALGAYCDCSCSRRKIRKTIEQLEIDEEEFANPVDSFRTFNDFFTRRLKAEARPFAEESALLSSPADCRLLVYPKLHSETCIPVKGAQFTLGNLLGPQGKEQVAEFAGGTLAVFRLCPADYHRYHYPADGRTIASWEIPGRLHSVNPLALALNIPIFDRNYRIVSLLDLELFGKTAFLEVGAFGVAGIVQTHQREDFARQEEKGYFKFGGSTLIMIFRPGTVVFDAKILEDSANGIETRILCGETIARSN